MAPPTKRRKPQPQRYECHTCLSSRISSQFPDSNPTSECEHLINTCKRCLKAWVESQIETTGGRAFTPHILCPECEGRMGRGDVEGVVSGRSFKRYVQLERIYKAENTPGWRWCLAPGCEAGHVHVSGEVEDADGDDDDGDDDGDGDDVSPVEPEPSDSHYVPGDGGWSQDGADWAKTSPPLEAHEQLRQREEQGQQQREEKQKQRQQELLSNPPPPKPDICKCNECGARACVPCDRPWHENETCADYQTRIQDRIEEEDATLEVIQKKTKKCPSCSRSIEKAGGCKHMFCTQCRTEFCWDCLHLVNHGGQYCACNGGPAEDAEELEDAVADAIAMARARARIEPVDPRAWGRRYI